MPKTAARSSGETRFQFVFSNHPIFHPFLSPEYGNLMEVRVSQYVRLNSSEAVPLVFSEAGAALFFQSTKFPGKLFVSAFGMERNQTSWPVHQTFIPFLDLALQSARAEDPTPSAFEPGEIITTQLPGGANAHVLVVRKEDREISRSVIDHGKTQLRTPDQPGLYNLTYDDSDQVTKVVAVNPPPRESQLSFTQPDETIKLWSVPGQDTAKTRVVPQPASISISAILQQRVWWWMLIAAVLVLTLEIVLAQAARERA